MQANLYCIDYQFFFQKKRINPLSHISNEELNRILEHHSEEIGEIEFPARPFLMRISDVSQNIWNWVADKVSFIVPNTNKYLITSKEIVEEILLSPTVAENMAQRRPYVSLSLLKYPFSENEDFVELFLKALHKNPKSVLYREISCNLSSSSSPYERYDFPPKNKLLTFFLQDAKHAEKYSVWKPIGDSVIEFLDKLYLENDLQYNMPLNLSDIYRSEDCPIANGIMFFDIMIREAFLPILNGICFYFTLTTLRMELYET
ncbi:MAG: hypothetical protein R3A45_08745 [Bdellovibrionota bacterium]